MSSLLLVVVAYLLGSINFSYLLPRLWQGMDIRQYGSCNAGATNAVRAVGWKFGLLTGCLDALKGLVAVAVGLGWGDPTLAAFCGAAAVCGHNWPVFFGFKGGKGIATTIGVTLCIAVWPALLAIAIGVLLALCTREVFIGSLAYVCSFMLLFLWVGPSIFAYQLLALFLVVVAFWSHRSNISGYIPPRVRPKKRA